MNESPQSVQKPPAPVLFPKDTFGHKVRVFVLPLIALLLIVGGVMWYGAVEKRSQGAEGELLLTAFTAVADGRYTEAQEIASSLLEKNKDSIPIALMLASMYLEEGRARSNEASITKAENLLAGVAQNAAKNSQYQDLAGVALYARGDYDGALDHYAQAVLIQPRNMLVFLHTADVLLAKGEYEYARKFYWQVIENGAGEIKARAYLGLAKTSLTEARDSVLAEEYLEKSLEAKGYRDTQAEVLSLLSVIKTSTGDTKGARMYAEKAILASPKSERGHVAMARALFALGEREQAEKSLDEALLLNAQGVSVYVEERRESENPFIVFMKEYSTQ